MEGESEHKPAFDKFRLLYIPCTYLSDKFTFHLFS